MSIESAGAFLERVRNDDEFRNQLGVIATPDKRLEFVKTNGFEFTKEELDEVQSELGDEELNDVAGGTWCGSTHENEHCGHTHEGEICGSSCENHCFHGCNY